MNKLLTNAKFWTALIAAIFNIVSFVVAKYYPEQQQLVTVIVASMDGIFGVMIAVLFGGDAIKTYKEVNELKVAAQIKPNETYQAIMAGKK